MSESPASPAATPTQQMESMLAGHLLAQCLHVTATLGIADHIAAGQRTAAQLAAATGCLESTLSRLLRTLVSRGVLSQDRDGRFGLTGLGETLRADTPESLRDKAIFEASAPVWAAIGGMVSSLRDGMPSFDGLHGMSAYRYLGENPELSAVFQRFMTAQSGLHNAAIVNAYDFSGIGTLVDVGGGHGATLVAVLDGYPAMRGVLFDQPHVVVGASLDAFRCETVGGDMLASVPRGGDAYLIKRVMMDKSDEDAVTVLRNCKEAMADGGRVLVVDPMLPEGGEPHPNWLTDMLMMLITEGKCRTRAEFGAIFEAGGFHLARVIPTASPNFLLEGFRA